MAKPVIFDDGGSVRIRELDDNVTVPMDGLIGSPFTSASSQQFFDGNKAGSSANNTCFLLFRSAAELGGLTTSPPIQLTIKSIVTIATADQTVTVTFDAVTGLLNVALSASASASEHGSRRWYVMRTELIQSAAYTAAVATATVPSSGTLAATKPASTMVHFVDVVPKNLLVDVKPKRTRK